MFMSRSFYLENLLKIALFLMFVVIIVDCSPENDVFMNSAMDVGTEGDLHHMVSEPFDESRLVFQPAVLSYVNSPVCIPTVSEFVINNTFDYDVQLFSVVSDNTQFHPVMFQSQVLPSQQSLAVQLLFLPYFVEQTNATLTFSSSIGDISYSVQGAAVKNDYLIHPFVGHRLPAGVVYEQPIVIYNPFAEVLHIREVFTTEEFMSLRGASMGGSSNFEDEHFEEQTTFGSDTSSAQQAKMWEIEPFTSKEIIRLSISSKATGDYQGYVHIKTNKNDMVIPVELLVIEGGLSIVPEIIDFGVIPTPDLSRYVDIYIVNSGSVDVDIMDVVPVEPDPLLTISAVGAGFPLLVAGEKTLAFRVVLQGHTAGLVENRLLVMTNHPNPALATIETPYRGSIMHGGLGFDNELSYFFLPVNNRTWRNSADIVALEMDNARFRSFPLTNFFNSDISVEAVSASSCLNMIIVAVDSNITEPVPGDLPDAARSLQFTDGRNIIESNSVWDEVRLVFDADRVLEQFLNNVGTNPAYSLPFQCNLEIWTNISTHKIPLYIFDGAVDVTFYDASVVNPENFTYQDIHGASPLFSTYKKPSENSKKLRKTIHPSGDVGNRKFKKSPSNSRDGGSTDSDGDTDRGSDGGSVSSLSSNASEDISGSDDGDLLEDDSVGGSDYASPINNKNVLVADIGTISLHKPKPALILLGNPHPFDVSVSLLYANINVSLCFVASWLRGGPADEVANSAAISSGNQLIDAALSAGRNSRTNAAINRDYVHYHVANTLGLHLPNVTRDDIPLYGKCIYYPKNARTAKKRWSYKDDHFMSPYTPTGELYIEPGHTMLIAIEFHGAYGLNGASALVAEASNKAVVTRKTSKKDKAERLSDGGSQGGVGARNQPMKYKETVLPVLDYNLDFVQVKLSTPYQLLDLRYRLQGVAGYLESVIRPDNCTFVLGINDKMVMHTSSRFYNNVTIVSLAAYTNFFYIRPSNLGHGMSTAPENLPSNGLLPGKVFCALHITPKFMCTGTEHLVSGSDKSSLTSNVAMYDCLKYIMENILLKNSSYSSYLEDFATYSSVEPVEPPSLRRALERMLMRSTYVVSHFRNKQYVDAFQEHIKLKNEWTRTYPNGFTLPPAEISLKTPATHHIALIPETKYFSPLTLVPDINQIQLPPVLLEQVVIFYLKVHNPFSVPVAFSIAMDPARGSSYSYNSVFWQTQPIYKVISSTTHYVHSRGAIANKPSTTVPPPAPESNFTNDTPYVDDTVYYWSVSRRLSVSDDADADSEAEMKADVKQGLSNEKVGKKRSKTKTQGGSGAAADSVPDPITIVTGVQFIVKNLNLLSLQQKVQILTAANEVPFILHPSLGSGVGKGSQTSVSPTEYTALPGASILLGPFAFVPTRGKQNPMDLVHQVQEVSVYVTNNFTGIDRVDVRAESGAGRFGLNHMYVYKTVTANAPQQSGEDVEVPSPVPAPEPTSSLLTTTLRRLFGVAPSALPDEPNLEAVTPADLSSAKRNLKNMKLKRSVFDSSESDQRGSRTADVSGSLSNITAVVNQSSSAYETAVPAIIINNNRMYSLNQTFVYSSLVVSSNSNASDSDSSKRPTVPAHQVMKSRSSLHALSMADFGEGSVEVVTVSERGQLIVLELLNRGRSVLHVGNIFVNGEPFCNLYSHDGTATANTGDSDSINLVIDDSGKSEREGGWMKPKSKKVRTAEKLAASKAEEAAAIPSESYAQDGEDAETVNKTWLWQVLSVVDKFTEYLVLLRSFFAPSTSTTVSLVMKHRLVDGARTVSTLDPNYRGMFTQGTVEPEQVDVSRRICTLNGHFAALSVQPGETLNLTISAMNDCQLMYEELHIVIKPVVSRYHMPPITADPVPNQANQQKSIAQFQKHLSMQQQYVSEELLQQEFAFMLYLKRAPELVASCLASQTMSWHHLFPPVEKHVGRLFKGYNVVMNITEPYVHVMTNRSLAALQLSSRERMKETLKSAISFIEYSTMVGNILTCTFVFTVGICIMCFWGVIVSSGSSNRDKFMLLQRKYEQMLDSGLFATSLKKTSKKNKRQQAQLAPSMSSSSTNIVVSTKRTSTSVPLENISFEGVEVSSSVEQNRIINEASAQYERILAAKTAIATKQVKEAVANVKPFAGHDRANVSAAEKNIRAATDDKNAPGFALKTGVMSPASGMKTKGTSSTAVPAKVPSSAVHPTEIVDTAPVTPDVGSSGKKSVTGAQSQTIAGVKGSTTKTPLGGAVATHSNSGSASKSISGGASVSSAPSSASKATPTSGKKSSHDVSGNKISKHPSNAVQPVEKAKINDGPYHESVTTSTAVVPGAGANRKLSKQKSNPLASSGSSSSAATADITAPPGIDRVVTSAVDSRSSSAPRTGDDGSNLKWHGAADASPHGVLGGQSQRQGGGNSTASLPSSSLFDGVPDTSNSLFSSSAPFSAAPFGFRPTAQEGTGAGPGSLLSDSGGALSDKYESLFSSPVGSTSSNTGSYPTSRSRDQQANGMGLGSYDYDYDSSLSLLARGVVSDSARQTPQFSDSLLSKQLSAQGATKDLSSLSKAIENLSNVDVGSRAGSGGDSNKNLSSLSGGLSMSDVSEASNNSNKCAYGLATENIPGVIALNGPIKQLQIKKQQQLQQQQKQQALKLGSSRFGISSGESGGNANTNIVNSHHSPSSQPVPPSSDQLLSTSLFAHPPNASWSTEDEEESRLGQDIGRMVSRMVASTSGVWSSENGIGSLSQPNSSSTTFDSDLYSSNASSSGQFNPNSNSNSISMPCGYEAPPGLETVARPPSEAPPGFTPPSSRSLKAQPAPAKPEFNMFDTEDADSMLSLSANARVFVPGNSASVSGLGLGSAPVAMPSMGGGFVSSSSPEVSNHLAGIMASLNSSSNSNNNGTGSNSGSYYESALHNELSARDGGIGTSNMDSDRDWFGNALSGSALGGQGSIGGLSGMSTLDSLDLNPYLGSSGGLSGIASSNQRQGMPGNLPPLSGVSGVSSGSTFFSLPASSAMLSGRNYNELTDSEKTRRRNSNPNSDHDMDILTNEWMTNSDLN